MQAPASNADRKRDRRGRRISVQTLLIASIASAVASFLASRVWGSGTLVSAAATPVIVALVSESLRRPVQVVAQTARKLPSVPGDGRDADAAPQSVGEPVAEDASPPGATGAQTQAGRPRWRWAVVTGLLAFAIVVAIFTVPDLLAGRSITGDGQPTTFFGGSSSSNDHETSTTTTSTPTTTITRTASSTTTATTSLGGATRTSETTSPTTTTTTSTSASPSTSTSTTTATTSATGGAAPSPAGATTPAP